MCHCSGKAILSGTGGTFVFLGVVSLIVFRHYRSTNERNRGLDSAGLSLNRFFEGVPDGLLISVLRRGLLRTRKSRTVRKATGDQRRETGVLFFANGRNIKRLACAAAPSFLARVNHLRQRQRSSNEYIYTCYIRLSNRHHGGWLLSLSLFLSKEDTLWKRYENYREFLSFSSWGQRLRDCVRKTQRREYVGERCVRGRQIRFLVGGLGGS